MEGIAVKGACWLPPPIEGICIAFAGPTGDRSLEMREIAHPGLCHCERVQYDILAPMCAISRFITLLLATTCAFGQYLRGVNLAGAEFGENSIPGTFNTHYTYNSERSFRYFGARNLTILRVAVRWERLQPRLRDSLD